MDPYLYEESRQRMARLARNFGIASLVCSFMFGSLFFVVIGFACLSVLIAFLSKGKKPRFDSTAKVGMISGLLGTVITLSLLGHTDYKLYNDVEYRNTIIETGEKMYGDMYRELYGIDISETINNIFGGNK